MSTFIYVLFPVCYFIITIFLCRGIRLRTKEMCMCALCIALTLVLEQIIIPLPTGATIPLASTLPLMLLALLVDYRLAFVSGWICGIFSLILIPTWLPVHWAQIFVEHMTCFSCLGYTAIFGNDKRWKIVCGSILAFGIKVLFHVISGIIFYSANAWSGWGAVGYSIVYNLSQNLPLCILSVAIIMVLPLKSLIRWFDRI